MKQYTSCFIGVPLPNKFQKEFERLLADVGNLHPNWEIVYPKTPHITIYYLDKQSQNVLPAIASIIQTKINFLNKLVLSINGFDCFNRQDPREGIVFLTITYSVGLVDFNRELTNALTQYYSSDNNLPFHPHITIARVSTSTNRSNIKNSVSLINQQISKINWRFPITEIVLYGVDSTKHPQHQKKLIRIQAT